MTPRNFVLGAAYRPADYRTPRQRSDIYIPLEQSARPCLACGYHFVCGLGMAAIIAIIVVVT